MNRLWNRWLSLGSPASSRRRVSSPLGIESLERRECHAVDVGFSPAANSLAIASSDSQNHAVTVLQNDETNSLRVLVDGVTRLAVSSSQIRNVAIQLGAGHDSVSYLMEGQYSFAEVKYGKLVTVQTGDGNDVVRINTAGLIDQNFQNSTNLYFGIQTGSGFDQVQATLGSQKLSGTSTVQADLGPGWTGSARLIGPVPDQVGQVTIQGNLIDGAVVVGVQGGDAVRDNLRFRFPVGNVGSQGSVNATLNGRGGNDTLTADAEAILDGTLRIRLLGGAGDDRLQTNVTSVNDHHGLLDLTVWGEDGNDTLGMAVYEKDHYWSPDAIDNGSLTDLVLASPDANDLWKIDGGAGTQDVIDSANTSFNVSLINWELFI